ncbi:MAG TPA: hypothetical protein VIC24_13460 [Gemmatimonadaceae bacterium]|jgi:hypothetical protein
MDDRQYNEDEVAAIFRAAADQPESKALPAGGSKGLTLSELQSIAREVGISPDAVARSAQALDRSREPLAAQAFLRLPIAVERTVALDRRLTDQEWELLVVDLRTVFRARGVVRSTGTLREWSNGNLQALLEPTPTGYQLRLRTFKGNARSSITMGALMLGMATVAGAFVAANGTLAHSASGLGVLAAMGAAFLASGTLRLPGWARLRRRQMDDIIDRLTVATKTEGSASQIR